MDGAFIMLKTQNCEVLTAGKIINEKCKMFMYTQ